MHVSTTEQLELVPERYRIPDALWTRIEPLLPLAPAKGKGTKGGRPRADDRLCMEGIFYLLRTGTQWNAIPRCFGPSSTVHDRFQEWREADVFAKLWVDALLLYDQEVGLDWEWQAMDAAMTKAPLGGEKLGRTRRTGRRAGPSEAS
jgi:putative transposase